MVALDGLTLHQTDRKGVLHRTNWAISVKEGKTKRVVIADSTFT